MMFSCSWKFFRVARYIFSFDSYAFNCYSIFFFCLISSGTAFQLIESTFALRVFTQQSRSAFTLLNQLFSFQSVFTLASVFSILSRQLRWRLFSSLLYSLNPLISCSSPFIFSSFEAANCWHLMSYCSAWYARALSYEFLPSSSLISFYLSLIFSSVSLSSSLKPSLYSILSFSSSILMILAFSSKIQSCAFFSCSFCSQKSSILSVGPGYAAVSFILLGWPNFESAIEYVDADSLISLITLSIIFSYLFQEVRILLHFSMTLLSCRQISSLTWNVFSAMLMNCVKCWGSCGLLISQTPLLTFYRIQVNDWLTNSTTLAQVIGSSIFGSSFSSFILALPFCVGAVLFLLKAGGAVICPISPSSSFFTSSFALFSAAEGGLGMTFGASGSSPSKIHDRVFGSYLHQGSLSGKIISVAFFSLLVNLLFTKSKMPLPLFSSFFGAILGYLLTSSVFFCSGLDSGLGCSAAFLRFQAMVRMCCRAS